MKNSVRLALLCMAASAAPAFAQNASPMCGATNLDQSRNIFTIVNPAAGAVNQQCYVVVYPAGSMPAEAQMNPSSYLAEGRYLVELSGGGGGGGGGSSSQGNKKPDDQGGGGGGAGAAPSRTFEYLSPGVYKLTIGTGGFGGSGNGGHTGAGNPTSLTSVNTGLVIAGFPGSDIASKQSRPSGAGEGGIGAPGGSSGGSGTPGGSSGGSGAGSSASPTETGAQTGSALSTPGYYGVPGQAGVQSGHSATTDGISTVQSSAGGGGGAGVGSGGAGDSSGRNTVAGVGDLGGGGGGGRGGFNTADTGGAGGNGFIRLSMSEPARQAAAPVTPVAPVIIVPAPQIIVLVPIRQKYSFSGDALFGFGKTDLMPSGEAQLDELIAKLRDVNVESISDIGHADRIGSPELNQRVSERRAESVKAYLVSKGIQSDRISASGMGQSQPVTNLDDCKGVKAARLIACLQPDRRVDIEVVGTKR